MVVWATNFSNDDYRLVLTANQENDQDYDSNSSVIAWDLSIEKLRGSGFFWSDSRGAKSVRIDGDDVASGEVKALNFTSGDASKSIASGRKRVYHDADGTKDVGFSFGVNGLPIGSAARGSLSLAMDRIPRGPRVRVNGVYRNTVAYVKISGVWRLVIPYVRINGTWRIGGG